MTYRRAESLTTLVDQCNAAAPDRDKSSDGWIGDESHQNRNSDHNPWIWDDETDMWVVSAQDITNDPQNGMPSRELAERLVSGKDERIKYVISDEEICSGTGQDHTAWQWRPYTGSNPHTAHMHLSVKSDKAHYDDTTKWTSGDFQSAPGPAIPRLPVLRFGDKGPQVKFLQQQLVKQGYEIRIDSDFGPNTQKAIEAFQYESGLTVDGIVGTYTWRALLGPELPTEVIHETGKCSWFGGSADTGVSGSEGLAFLYEINATNQHLFVPIQPPNTTGLARRLNPYVHFFAYRFDYNIYPKEMLASMKHVALIRNVATGKTLTAFPADWGPHADTGRILDLSKGLLDDLQLLTDQDVEIIFPWQSPSK